MPLQHFTNDHIGHRQQSRDLDIELNAHLLAGMKLFSAALRPPRTTRCALTRLTPPKPAPIR